MSEYDFESFFASGTFFALEAQIKNLAKGMDEKF